MVCFCATDAIRYFFIFKDKTTRLGTFLLPWNSSHSRVCVLCLRDTVKLDLSFQGWIKNLLRHAAILWLGDMHTDIFQMEFLNICYCLNIFMEFIRAIKAGGRQKQGKPNANLDAKFCWKTINICKSCLTRPYPNISTLMETTSFILHFVEVAIGTSMYFNGLFPASWLLHK